MNVKRLFDPLPSDSVVCFRVAFGALMLVEVARYFLHGWITRYYVAPLFHFTYFGFEWVRPWPGVGMYVHFAALAMLAACIMAGIWYRAAVALFFFAFTYVFLLDQALYLNHFYLICLLSAVLMVVPADRPVIPRWNLWLLRTQIGVPYFFGGIAKLNADWLSGNPLRVWLASRSDMPIVGPWLTLEPTVWVFVYGSVVFDLFIVPLLLYRRTRTLAFCVAVAFHLINWRLFDIGVFPPLMIAATTVFFDPDWPRKLPLISRVCSIAAESAPHHNIERAALRPVIVALLAAYVTVQAVVPLRHLLYPGDVDWTEEGHRFSWRMKLRAKHGGVEFAAIDAVTHAQSPIDPRRYLAEWQIREMTARPDMILQFSRYAAGRLRASTGRPVDVRVRAWVSLNGRPPQLMIDPNVNLAAQPRTLAPAPWILPLYRSSSS